MAILDDTQLCLDTGVLIAYLKGREPGATAVERVVSEYTCYVTTITVYELLFGVARAQKQIGEESLLSMMGILPLDYEAARYAARLHNELIRRNQDIGIKDVLIAAICRHHNMQLLTLNERHFARVSGLKVLDVAALVSGTLPNEQ
jgi:tRNA(fMet)-specific endonuclease VapC